MKKHYSDNELLALLEENGYSITYKNLKILREGIENGSIEVDDDKPLSKKEASSVVKKYAAADKAKKKKLNAAFMGNLVEEEQPEEEVPEEEEVPAEEEVPVEGEQEVPVEGEVPAEAGLAVQPGAEISPEEAAAMAAQQQQQQAMAAQMPRVNIVMPTDGSMAILNQNKQVSVDQVGNVQATIMESHNKYASFVPFRKAYRPNSLLESFLVEDCEMDKSFVVSLTEDARIDSLKSILSELLKAIEGKLSGLDTSIADRSRGEITKLKELPEIQDAVTKLEAMLERDEDAQPDYLKAVEIIIRALLNINKYAPDFKEAYRNKKTILIMRYQSLILSVISAISYLLSAIVDYKGGNMTIKPDVEVNLSIGPLKSLADFNKSVESGEFKRTISDVVVVREYFLEVPTETMSMVLEASDYLPMIIDGVKNLYRNLDNNGKLVNLIYKAVGVITLVLSIRDILYTLGNMKSSISSMLGNIKLFSGNGETGGILNKLAQFATGFKNDVEFGDKVAKMEVEDQNRQIAREVKELSLRRQEPETPAENPVADEKKPLGAQAPVSQDALGISDFSLDF